MGREMHTQPTANSRAPGSLHTAKGQRTRARILNAALKVFGQSGYYSASIVDITKSAKVAQGTFYLYFPSKLDVFVELFDHLGHEMRRRMRDSAAAWPDRINKERAGLGAVLDFASEHPQLFRVAREAEFVVPERWFAWYDRIITPYEKALKDAMRRGEIRQLDPTLTAYALIGLADFVGVQLVLHKGFRKVPEGTLDALAEFIAGGLQAASYRPSRKATARQKVPGAIRLGPR